MSKGKNNLTPKIFALLIAVFLWSYVMSEVNPERPTEYRNIPVTYQNMSALERQGLVIMDPKEAKVNVKVTGKKSDMDKFSSSGGVNNIVVQVDLSGYREGQFKVPVKVSLSDNSSNIKIVSWEPQEILFTFDELITDEREVKVETTGELGNNFVLENIDVKPETVLISGPRRWVNEVSEVKAIVGLEGRQESVKLKAPIQLLDDKGNVVRGVESKPDTVDVGISILRKKTLPIRLQTKGELPDNFTIYQTDIHPSTVTVKGDKSLEDLDYINTKPIDVNSLLVGSSMEVELDLPENIQLLNPEQKISLTYSIEEAVSKEFKFAPSELEIRNLDDKLNLESIDYDKEIQLILGGSRITLENINKDSIKLYLDLKDIAEGSHQVEIKVEIPKDVTIESINPKNLKLNLKKKEEG
ncbi:YbbR-like domain-containing protein [Wansuia hejianensis]|uniref:YbbR-like protein n=1 Tax=Wansuia hejianensis TaxID=2763667 RepID=A0A926EYX8_9FIRM|nr:CdaR family protein [Wansuia hejianensis]MBC8591521.1 hypothetical protein [Wansuia hejianensis]